MTPQKKVALMFIRIGIVVVAIACPVSIATEQAGQGEAARIFSSSPSDFDQLMEDLEEPILPIKREAESSIVVRLTVFPPFSLPYVFILDEGSVPKVTIKKVFRMDCKFPVSEGCLSGSHSYAVQIDRSVIAKETLEEIRDSSEAIEWEDVSGDPPKREYLDGETTYVLELYESDTYIRIKKRGCDCPIFSEDCQVVDLIEEVLSLVPAF